MTLQFNSPQYAAFLVVFAALYWLLPRQWRRALLLIGSYGFYATFDWRFTPLLVATTFVHYGIGRRLEATSNAERRKVLLVIGVLFTLGVLGFFKYAGWADTVLAKLFGLDPSIGDLALPIGISYYTFHTLSYSVDVYRREQPATDDLLGFALFVAYFPQLLSGPLTRARRMLPQFARLPRSLTRTGAREALELILIGLFQKVALADALSSITNAAFIDTTRGPAPVRNWLMLVLAAMTGMAQLVLDLTGYSNIARGTSKLLGIELPHNFRQPLTRSRNLQDYWRRHHLTLMAWLRDYVFRPLRARFGTRPVVAFVLVVVVFTTSGIWHGSSAGWQVWGFVVGIGVATETASLRALDRRKRARRAAVAAVTTPTPTPPAAPTEAGLDEESEFPAGNPYAAPMSNPYPSPSPVRRRGLDLARQVRSNLLCLLFLGACAVLIRTPSLGAAGAFYREVLQLQWAPIDANNLLLLAYVAAAVIVVDRREAQMERVEGSEDPPTFGRILLWAALVLGLVVFSGTAGKPFVYLGF